MLLRCVSLSIKLLVLFEISSIEQKKQENETRYIYVPSGTIYKDLRVAEFARGAAWAHTRTHRTH